MSNWADDFLRALDGRINERIEARSGGRIGVLERRLDAIVDRLDNATPQPVATSSNRCIVPEERILRWERIEKMANELCFGPSWPDKRADDFARLREALNP